MNPYLYVFLISLLPVIELRGAIPVGCGLGLPFFGNFAVAVLGNLLPVPFILLFVRVVLAWMKGVPFLSKFALWLEEKANRGAEKINRYATWGLFLFVAIPFPGTGAWTGSLIAALLQMKPKYAILSIVGGVLAAGVIVTLASYGAVGAFRFFLPN